MEKKNYGWIGGILMIFFTPATSYGYIVVYDAASSLKAKVSSVWKEKTVWKPLWLILWFLHNANFC